MKPYLFTTLSIAIASVFLEAFGVTAETVKIQHPKFINGTSNAVPGQYIIRFDSKSTDSDKHFLQSFKQEFGGLKLKVKQEIKHDFFNAISVDISHANKDMHETALKSILERSDVKAVYPIKQFSQAKVFRSENANKKRDSAPSFLPHAMTQVDIVHSKLKNKGKGIFVGVIDSGIDYLHPALGGGFGKGYKVAAGYDLVGDDYSGTNTPVPDDDPMDSCSTLGHGTHVSGIIAGYDTSNNFTGVAPEATLGMWRVFGCGGGSVGTDILIKAMLMAYDAGVDVINLSIYSVNAWSNVDDPEINVVNQIASKGVSVVACSGDAGDSGIYTVGRPSVAPGAFSVASIQNEYFSTKYITATGIDHNMRYLQGGDNTPKDGELAAGDIDASSNIQACDLDHIPSDVQGKIALIKFGACKLHLKVSNVASKGAVSVIVYNNVPGDLRTTTSGLDLPVVTVSQESGVELRAALDAGKKVYIGFHPEGQPTPVEDGRTVNSFSSVGPTAELDLNPHIAAVGGRVYSTLPRRLGSWGIMSGGSMASPYVAGSIALYLHAHGKNRKSIKYIQEQFQNYASPVSLYNKSTIDSPVRQGAGLLQVYDTLTQHIHVSPAQISFNDTASTKYRTQTITVTNSGDKTVQFEVLNDVSTGVVSYNVDESGYMPIEPAGDSRISAKLRFSTKNFKVAPGASQKITITVTPPTENAKNYIIYGGFVRLKSLQQGNNVDLKIPYIGVNNKLSSLPILGEGSPFIVNQDSQNFGLNYNYTVNRSNDDYLTIYMQVVTPSAHIKGEVLKNNKMIGKFGEDLDYISRNALTTNQYTTWKFSGNYIPSGSTNGSFTPLPEGTYQFRIRALKRFSNPAVQSNWYNWLSGPITVEN